MIAQDFTKGVLIMFMTVAFNTTNTTKHFNTTMFFNKKHNYLVES